MLVGFAQISTANALQKKKTATAEAKTPAKTTKGTVVDISALAATGDGTVNKAKADEATKNGHVLGFMVGTGKSAKVYFVVKVDGGSYSARLAALADNPVGITGKMVSKNGVNVIVADMVETMK